MSTSTPPPIASADIGAQDATLPAPSTGDAAANASRSRGGELGDARFVGPFALLRKIGEGGMGVVYAAFDEELGRRVALKLLHGGDPLRLLREAQALARLSHPNVVQIYAVGRFREQVYVAMEYVEGPTLDAWLRAEARSPEAILDAFIQAGHGLAAAHRSGLVHRDFKPSNVLVGDDGRVRVLDFGLARAGGAEADDDGERARAAETATSGASLTTTPGRDALQSPLTLTGALMGTPAYMSPEQHRGARVDARSDLFSFCVALFEALHGRRPFGGDDLVTIATNVLDGALITTAPRVGVSPRVDAAIRRGLAADPDARWPAMDELLAVLEATREHARAGSGLRPLLAFAALITVFALATTIVAVAIKPEELSEPASVIAYGVVMPVLVLAALPALRRRYARPDQRRWLGLGVIGAFVGLATRVVTWSVGFDVRSMMVTETLLYAVIFLVVAHFLRAPALFLVVALLVLSVPLLGQPGVDARSFTAVWLLSLPLAGALLWRRRGDA